MAGIEPQQPHRHRLKLSTFGSQFRLSGPSQLSQSLLSRRSAGPRNGPQCRSLGELRWLLTRLQRRRKQHPSLLQEGRDRALKPPQFLIRDRENREARIARHGRLRSILGRTAARHHDESVRERRAEQRSGACSYPRTLPAHRAHQGQCHQNDHHLLARHGSHPRHHHGRDRCREDHPHPILIPAYRRIDRDTQCACRTQPAAHPRLGH